MISTVTPKSLLKSVLHSINQYITFKEVRVVDFDGKTAYYDCVLVKNKKHSLMEENDVEEKMLVIEIIDGKPSYRFENV